MKRILIAGAIALSTAAFGQDPDPKIDPICQGLFNAYLTGMKVQGDLVQAASLIVAHRGRQNGYWRVVLEELKSNNPRTESSCVGVLGAMLAHESEFLGKNQPPNQGPRQIGIQFLLSPEVVQVLVERGLKADRNRRVLYLSVLRRAMADEGIPLYLKLLEPEEGFFRDENFGAAVALAQIARPEGYEWLVSQAGNQRDFFLFHPWKGDGANIAPYCVAVLQELTGKEFKSKVDWQAWWEKADRSALPRRRVRLFP